MVFVAPGMCSGSGIFDGYECSDVPALNDYVVSITLADGPFPACGDPEADPDLEVCSCPNAGVPGCADPNCCNVVCAQVDPLCCSVEWDLSCVKAAQSLGCAPVPIMPLCPCPGDCGDFDGDVDVVDFLALLAQWGMVESACDGDGGGVGITDFLELLADWGPCAP